MYWNLLKKYLHEDVLRRIMHGSNSEHVVATPYYEIEVWGTVDEKEFKLPVDADNIPAGVMVNAQTSGLVRHHVEKAQAWIAKTKPGAYTKQQRKIWLWKLKACVATSLCQTAQSELRAIAGV